jgi:hypothetical protein
VYMDPPKVPVPALSHIADEPKLARGGNHPKRGD